MKTRLILFTVFALFSVTVFAQTKVTGTILDETGEAAIGANITVDGTTIGTVSDFDGHFELVVPDGTKKIKVSYIGYKDEYVAVAPSVTVKLSSDTQQIQEVVVQGMVSQDKRLFTGATTCRSCSRR